MRAECSPIPRLDTKFPPSFVGGTEHGEPPIYRRGLDAMEKNQAEYRGEDGLLGGYSARLDGGVKSLGIIQRKLAKVIVESEIAEMNLNAEKPKWRKIGSGLTKSAIRTAVEKTLDDHVFTSRGIVDDFRNDQIKLVHRGFPPYSIDDFSGA